MEGMNTTSPKKCRLLYTPFHLTIMPINPLFIQFENRLEVQAEHR